MKRSNFRGNADPSALLVPSEFGVTPDSRLRNAWQAWDICDSIETSDRGRSLKRTRIYKAYNRFPPTEYSKLAALGEDWQSNVNFGMLAFVVDNNLSSFFDMLTERVYAADIRTKKGNIKQRKEWSDHISCAFDQMLREWDDFLINQEQCLLDMLLFHKGLEIWEDIEGCCTEHLPADDFLLPDGVKINLSNFDVGLVKRRYTIHELWEKVQNDAAEERGWNKDAVLNAIRTNREEWKKKYRNNEDFAKDIAEGNIAISSHLKETVDCRILFVKEFKDGEYSGKISKFIILRDYGAVISDVSTSPSKKTEEFKQAIIKKEGFLFAKLGYADTIHDIIAVFMDCAGSGMWHRGTSLAEKIFVQCRQYDFTMNAIMDAVKINMSLLLQASTPEAAEKIKALVFGPTTVIPSDVPFVQQRLQLQTTEATQTVQFMMLDMFRGIGEYRVNEGGEKNQQKTATQTTIDSAEAAKLTGTQLKRFNGQHSLYYRKTYKRFVGLKDGEKDFEKLKKFKAYMKENGVPNSAWEYDNIDSITSNMLAGAGSPAQKLNAATQIINLTNISPKDEGQANARDDAIAAVAGRSNVSRYVNKVTPDKTFNERMAGYENQLLANPFVDPKNVQVNPDDHDEYHLGVHFMDMKRTVDLVNASIEKQAMSEYFGQQAMFKLLNQGGHCGAHIENLKRDTGKDDLTKQAVGQLNALQKMTDEMGKKIQAYSAQKQQAFDPTNDPDIMKKIAMNQLDVAAAQQLQDIHAGGVAAKHQATIENLKEKAATEVAAKRAAAVK